VALAGLGAGVVFDKLIANLARKPLEAGEIEPDDLRLRKDDGASIQRDPETGALVMPKALTTGWLYRRLLVIAATVLLFTWAAARYGDDPGHLLIVCAYIGVLVICTGTDLLAYRVPDVISLPAMILALVVGVTVEGADSGAVLVGGLVYGGVFLAMHIATGGGMGMGDVKLGFFVGFALGLSLGVIALLVTALAGGVIATALLLTRIRGRGDAIPYAPFIAIGALWVILMQGTAFVEL
jgi:prepilin signal peptidase PulO-like enzyme (type II secretory pathway)